MRCYNTLLILTMAIVACAFCSCGGHTTDRLTLASDFHGATAGSPPQAEPAALDPELLKQLSARLDEELAQYGTARRTAQVPMTDKSQVTDLAILEESEAGVTFGWSYRSQGDYDQNGETNAADITPLGLNFQKKQGEEGWAAAQPADGDYNGEVNVADITPIAVNFHNHVSGFLLQGSATPEDSESWTLVGSVPLSDGVLPEGGGFKTFSFQVADPDSETTYHVAPYFGDPADSPEIGIGSNEVLYEKQLPDAPLNLAASQGDLTGQILLTWDAAADATGYEVYRDGETEALASVGAVTQYTDTIGDLLDHTYRLKSLGPGGASDFSTPATGFASRRGDWWMFGREPTHHFLSPVNGPQDHGLKWVFSTGSTVVYCSPSLAADGTVYIGTADGSSDYLYAINGDGTQKWRFASPNIIEGAPAVAKSGVVYFGTSDALYALNPDGTQAWTYPLGGYGFASPAIAPDGTIYAAGTDSLLYAINPTGSLKWGRPTSDIIYSSPAIADNGTIYVGNESGDFYAINPAGDIDWTFTADDAVESSPAIGSDGVIYFGSMAGTFYALNPSGKERWTYPAGGAVFSSPAIADDGTLYFGTQAGDLLALTPSGALQWRFVTGASGWVTASPTLGADGVIYFGTGDSKYYAVNADGSQLWDFQSGGSFSGSSALGEDGTLYSGADDGRLYAFGVPPPVPPNAPTGLQATDGTLYQAIRLDWDEMFGVEQFEIFRDGGATPAATVDGEATSWVDEPVLDADEHTYKMRAVNAYGTSDYSDETTGTAGTVAPGPGDWYMFGHDQAHTRVSPFAGPTTEKTKWSVSIGSASYSSAAIGNYGELYIGSDSFNVTCVNPDGSIRWVFPTGNYVGCSPAIASDGTIYAGDWDGRFYAIKPDGTEKWHFDAGDSIYSPPNIADDGTIYFGSDDMKLYALHPDGSEYWDYPTNGIIRSSPAIGSDGAIYFGNVDMKVIGVMPDGSEKWTADVGDAVHGSAAVKRDEVNGDTIYIGSDDGLLYTFADDGTPGWTFTTGDSVFSSPAIGPDGSIYFGSYDGLVYCLHPDGSEKWDANMYAAVLSSPALDANGNVWVGDSGGFINMIDSSGFLAWFTFTSGPVYDSSPSIGPDGTVYIADTYGMLFAFGPGS